MQLLKRLAYVVLVTACFASVAPLPVTNSFAQSPSPLIQDVFDRQAILLNGDWHYIADPHDEGTPRRYYLNGRPFGTRDFVEYNFDTSPILHVPGDWNFQRPELQLYEGTIWYQKSFSYHPQVDTRALLYFGAANYHAQVWVNGQPLCEHEGGFTPFNCEATSLLQDGANFVIVSVNDARHADDIPALRPDWFNYGGLTRDVMLVEVPREFIEHYSIQLERGNSHRIAGWARLAGVSGTRKVTIRIPELKLSTETATDKDGLARFTLEAPHLQLWSPEKPKLYRVEISIASDRISE